MIKNDELRDLEKKALEIRKDLVDLAVIQNIHIGGDFSIADVMTVLWQRNIVYNPQNPKDESRDRFVLSKGHASAVTAFNQAAIGCFPKEEVMREYAADEGRFSMHPCNLINPFIDVSTGSLGHGMPIAGGMAAALKIKGNTRSRVYTIMGDGEQSEGSIWEAAMNAIHYELGNLIAILDYNKIEGDGFVRDLSGLGDIAEKYRCFGWNVVEIDGHDMAGIADAMDYLPKPDTKKPTILVCHTIKGKGISYMENQVKWHTGKLTQEQADEAKKELDNAFCRKWKV